MWRCGAGFTLVVLEEEEDEEEDEEEEEEGVERAVVAKRLSALDYLTLALADGPLAKDRLLARAAELGSDSRHLRSYLAPARRAKDDRITEHMQAFRLTPKGRRLADKLAQNTVTVSEPEAVPPAAISESEAVPPPAVTTTLSVTEHICLALAKHGRLSRADLLTRVSEGGCNSENVGTYLGPQRREQRGLFDVEGDEFVLTKDGAEVAAGLGVEPTYVQGQRSVERPATPPWVRVAEENERTGNGRPHKIVVVSDAHRCKMAEQIVADEQAASEAGTANTYSNSAFRHDERDWEMVPKLDRQGEQRGWEFSVPTFNTSNPIALERQLYVAYCHEPAANLGEFTTKAKLFRFHQANPQRTLADPTGAAP